MTYVPVDAGIIYIPIPIGMPEFSLCVIGMTVANICKNKPKFSGSRRNLVLQPKDPPAKQKNMLTAYSVSRCERHNPKAKVGVCNS